MNKKISEISSVSTLNTTAKIPISLTAGVAETATVQLIVDIARLGLGTSNFSGSYNDLTNKPSLLNQLDLLRSGGESANSITKYTWASGDKGGFKRVYFNNINGKLTSISFKITDSTDGTNQENKTVYALIYNCGTDTTYKTDGLSLIGSSTNAINFYDYNKTNKVLTYYFNNLQINSNFCVEFYTNTSWDSSVGTNGRAVVRIQSNGTTPENSDIVYGGWNGSINRFRIACEITYKPNTQSSISDLDTIRSGAAAGATAIQPLTTLAGYGITDAYTKTYIDLQLGDISSLLDEINGE